MWHYLFFIVLVKVKDSTEYTGPESYVAEMIKVNRERRHTHPPSHTGRILYPPGIYFACSEPGADPGFSLACNIDKKSEILLKK